MNEFLKLSQKDRQDIFAFAQASLGIQDVILEKDFWVCYLLDILFHKSKYGEYFVFKGGTSLSKGYDVIQRFSEDVDLVLDWELLGYEGNYPWEERSNTKQDAFTKEVNGRAAKWINSELKDELTEIVRQDKVTGKFFVDSLDPQTLIFEYPSLIPRELGYIQKTVRLEIGPLAAMMPVAFKNVQPYVATEMPQVFTGKNSIKLVASERTFWEKATILHKEAYRENGRTPTRYSRHYYDLYRLIQTEIKEVALSRFDILRDVVDFKNKFYRAPVAKYELATPTEIRLYPQQNQIELLEQDYDQMKDMMFGQIPNFDEILIGLKELEEEIHARGAQ